MIEYANPLSEVFKKLPTQRIGKARNANEAKIIATGRKRRAVFTPNFVIIKLVRKKVNRKSRSA